jgi:hypothetical protein
LRAGLLVPPLEAAEFGSSANKLLIKHVALEAVCSRSSEAVKAAHRRANF